MSAINGLDYRDRASVLVWAALVGLAAQRLLRLPNYELVGSLLGSEITLGVNGDTVLGLLLTALVATGVEAVVRAHPRWSEPDRVTPGWAAWGLPVAVIAVALLVLPITPSRLYWVLGLTLTGAVLGLSLTGIYFSLDPFAPRYRRARLGLNALTYAVALVLFLVVYRTRVRSLISATEVLLISGLLALELLRGSDRPLSLLLLYAGITGLVLGQATWALNYWRLDSLTGGLVLLLLFYNMVGLSQNALAGRINRRALLEFGLITIAALALIWEFAP
jgi:hypothetical protein